MTRNDLNAAECLASLCRAMATKEMQFLCDKSKANEVKNIADNLIADLGATLQSTGPRESGGEEPAESRSTGGAAGDRRAKLPRLIPLPASAVILSRWQRAEAHAEPSIREPAFEVVSFLGLCQVFEDVAVPEDLAAALKSPLPVELLAPASAEVLRQLEQKTKDARSLVERYDNAENDDVAFGYVVDLLQGFLQIQAAFSIVDYEYHVYYLDVDSEDSPFAKRIQELDEAFDALTQLLWDTERLSLLAQCRELLQEWRSRVTEEYCDTWVCDGTIEQAEERWLQGFEDRVLGKNAD